MLSPEENAALDELNGLSTEVAAALHSPWEPRCVAQCFRTRGEGDLAFTMQTWIDLEAARSPLLAGELPREMDDLYPALDAFGLAIGGMEPGEVAALATAMLRAVQTAFAMSLAMRQPDAEPGEETPDGFGAWLPLFACLVTQCGLSPAEAKQCDVGEAYALTAAHRRNQGWRAAGTEYALRDLAEGQNLQNEQNGEAAAPANSVHSVNSVPNTEEVD